MKDAIAGVGLVALAACFGLATACGGGGQDASKTPDTAASTAGPDGSGAPSASSAPSSAGSSASTTTTVLPATDGSGAKLASVDGGAGSGTGAGSGNNDPGRSRQDIQTAIGARKADARKCYDDAFTNHPGIEGDIVIKWKLDPKGVVSDIGADDGKSQIHDAGLTTCLSNVIKSIPFPPSQKGFESSMNYPFNFHPRGQQFNQMKNATP